MHKIDYVIIVIDVIVAMLTALGSPFGAPFFVLSSTIGLIDGARHKAITAAIVNSIFLALNVYFTVKNLILPLF